jgi:hypothetical protein
MYQEVFNSEGGRRNRVVRFDSIYEFVQPKDNPKSKQIWNDHVANHFKNGSAMRWLGAENRKEFDSILEKGDARYTKLVLENPVEAPPPQSIKRRKLQGDHGDEVDIHKINFGNLSTAWRRRSAKTRIGYKNIKLIANTSQSSGISVEESKWVGIAALAIANALEMSGYGVAIDVIMGAIAVTDQEDIAFLVPLKPYETPIDVQGLSAAICFPGFFRGPGFMNLGLAEGIVGSGLGMPLSDERAWEILPKYFTNPSEIVQLISNSCRSKEQVEKEVARIIEKVTALA